MDLSGISKSQLVLLATTERLGRRIFEMIFSTMTYDETGRLYVRLRKDGILLVEDGVWRLCNEARLFAQPFVEEAETIMAELANFLKTILDKQAIRADLKITRLGAYWYGEDSTCYRFNILDHGGELIVRGRFSSELTSNDGGTSSLQILSLKPPLEPQFDYLEETLLAHMCWAKKMKSIGRELQG